MRDLVMDGGATFSDCGTYRYRLWREWSTAPALNFVMLNPSTADATANDPTVERCQRRAVAMGFGGLVVTNLFALRSTDPKALYRHADPIGPENDESLREISAAAGMTIVGWGAHAAKVKPGRAARVLAMLSNPHALSVNSDGSPKHPLYCGYAIAPVPFASTSSTAPVSNPQEGT